jgi:polysaccharide biosynthesis/export protein
LRLGSLTISSVARRSIALSRRLQRGLGFLLLTMVLGCSGLAVRAYKPVPVSDLLRRSRPYEATTYRLVAGDQLTTRFYFNPQLDEDVRVRPDGSISLSLVGDLPAAGKTVAQLSTDITNAYTRYFVKANAVVIVREFSEHRIFTAGELRHPGQFSLLSNAKTVLESIAASGGLTDEASISQVILIRRLPTEPQPLVAQLDVGKALSGEDPTQDVPLMANDFLYVPKSGAADLNLAMSQYVFRNLNLSTNVGVTATYPLGIGR